MSSDVQIYVTLVAIGFFLIGAEVFLPGGVIGVMGSMALIAAAVMGFSAFGTTGGLISALSIVIFTGVCILVWVKFFPHTPMGRMLTLHENGTQVKSPTADLPGLLDKEGTSVTVLRPSGIAAFDGRRADVIADGNWIESGKRVRVIRVEGFRVLVREITESADSKEPPA